MPLSRLRAWSWWRPAGLALSLGNLIFIREWAALLHEVPARPDLGPAHPFYESLSAPPAAYEGMLCLVLSTALCLFAVSVASRRYPRFEVFERALLIGFFGVFLVRLFYLDSSLAYSIEFLWSHFWTRVLLGVPPYLAFWIGLTPISIALFAQSRRCAGAVRILVLMLFPLVAYNFGVSLHRSFSPRWTLHSAAQSTAPLVPRPAPTRVVWFVFDKWDYGRTFVSPTAGLKFPALAALASRAIVAQNAYPPAHTTDRSFASYLLGRLVTEPIHWSQAGYLAVGLPDSVQEVPWRALPNLFQQARGLGVRSSVLGFYLPYCRLLSDSVEDCYRMPVSERFVLPYAKGVLANSFKFLRDSASRSTTAHGLHPANFLALRREVFRAVGDANVDLVFVHWPIPHEPYIYDSERDDFPLGGSRGLGYDDHLLLLDRLVAEMNETLKKSSLDRTTTVLVTSDHPTYQADSSGRRWDPRVPFLLSLKGQTHHVSFPQRFSTLASTSLVLGLLSGSVQTEADATRQLSNSPRTLGLGYEPPQSITVSGVSDFP